MVSRSVVQCRRQAAGPGTDSPRALRHTTRRVPPGISQQTVADIVGTTRSRVNIFLKKFTKLGYIEYNDGLKVNDSLVRVILRDERVRTKKFKTG